MSEARINPRFLFPASGWKCFQCSILNEGKVEFRERNILGWGVVEGYDCGEGEELTEGSQMELLVALPDGPTDAPMVQPASQLSDWAYNSEFGFTRDEELTDEFKKQLEKSARANMERVRHNNSLRRQREAAKVAA